ncbi:MAG TPA: dTDP-4-dehydrorhamnose reductase [Vicinamibacterales bacterium]
MRVLVTGAHGQLGSTIAGSYTTRAEVIALNRQQLDLGDSAATERIVASHRPDVVINCAAFNDVDGAEDHPIDAIQVNALAVRALAKAAAVCGARLVHFGTDFVFDGRQGDRPYVETDPPSPMSVYGASKLLGEWFAADAPHHYVLRVESLFGGTRRPSTIDRIVAAIHAGQPVKVFVDRTVTPSFVQDVADATWRLLEIGPAPGVYHCVNTGLTTWFDLAMEIARVLNVESELLVPTRVAEVTLKAKRPQYAALSNDKLRDAGIVMPAWHDAIRRYLSGHQAVTALRG